MQASYFIGDERFKYLLCIILLIVKNYFINENKFVVQIMLQQYFKKSKN